MKIKIFAVLGALIGLAPAQTNTTVSANVHSILQAADYAAIRSLLGLAGIYQSLDADLTTIGGLADPNADRLLFWDDSAGAYTFLTIGSGLSLTGTTLTATGGGGGFDSAANYTLTGDWDFSTGTVAMGALSVTTLDATTLEISNVPVTTTAAELNALDGIPAGLTSIEIGYIDAVTGPIQAQIDSKEPRAPTRTGSHATPSTANPLSPVWTGSLHSVYYGVTGQINLPDAASYDGRVLMVYNTGAFTITINPNGSEVVVRDGNVQTGGISFTLSAGAGNFVGLQSDGGRWITYGFKGALSPGS